MNEGERQPRVLLVDSDDLLVSLLKERLEFDGILVEICADGARALSDVQRFVPDLIVMDLMLPSRSGLEILFDLRNDPNFRRLPVIVLTHLHGREINKQAKSLEIVEFMNKTDHTLAQMVENIESHAKVRV